MRLSKAEFSVYTSAAVIICVFSTLFYFDFTSRAAVGQERVVGSVTFKKRVAQRKFASQVVWEDIEQREPVYNNDSIRTSEGSETVIRLVDGTEIMVNENSMILLSLATNEIDIQFRGGSISARRGGIEEGGIGSLNITSGETTVSLDKSDVQVSGEKDRGINVTVNRGEAKVTAGDTVRKVEENQRVTVAEDAKKVEVVSLPVRPLTPLPDSVIVTQAETASVVFTWEPLKAEQNATFELAGTGPGARDRIVRRVRGVSVTLGLPPGSYAWRLAARDTGSGKTEESGYRNITVIRERPARLISPANGQVFSHAGENPIIPFAWSGGEAVQEYRVTVATDPGMGSAIGSVTTSDTRIAIDTLGPGTYYWRVSSRIRVGGRDSSALSGTRSFRVSKATVVEPPRPLYPADGGTVRSRVMAMKGMLFSWEQSADVTGTVLTIAKDASFGSVVYTAASKINVLAVRKRLEPGTYYWRVTGRLPGNRLTAPSTPMRFTVSASESIRLLAPADAAEVRLAGATGSVRFSWEQPEPYGEYLIQLSRDRSFGRLLREERVQGGSAVLAGLTGGAYYWRILLKGGEGGPMMKSGTSSITVRELLETPTITAPRYGEVIDYDRLEEVNISWKRPAEANRFRLRFYRMENNRPEFIAERILNAAAMELDAMSFLEEGRYQFSVQALEVSEDGERVLRESPVARTSFEVRIHREKKKLKIITPKILFLE